MEIKLTLDELQAIITASREKEERQQKFAAALQGVDLDKNKGDEVVDAVKRRANAKIKGISEEEEKWSSLGIDYVKG